MLTHSKAWGEREEAIPAGNAGKVQTVNPLHTPLRMDSVDLLYLLLSKVQTCIENTDEIKNGGLVCFQSYRRACISGLVWFELVGLVILFSDKGSLVAMAEMELSTETRLA